VDHQILYERLGGVNAIAMIVDRFSDAIVEIAAAWPAFHGRGVRSKPPTLRSWPRTASD
jgi:hypothetical protein